MKLSNSFQPEIIQRRFAFYLKSGRKVVFCLSNVAWEWHWIWINEILFYFKLLEKRQGNQI